MTANSRIAMVAILAAASLVAGCAPQPATPTTRPTGVVMDPCADALHELEGELLQHYALNQRLPDALDELNPRNPRPACPVSRHPYVYRSEGIRVAGVEGRIIVWEKAPCRPGVRWVIVMLPGDEGQALHLNVIPVAVKQGK